MPASLAAEAETSFEVWKQAFASNGAPTFSLGKENAHLWDWLRPHLDAQPEEYALGRAIYGTRKLHVPSRKTLASLGPGPHPTKEHLEDTRLVTPDDVAAAAAWMNALDRRSLLRRNASKPDGWKPSPEDADRIWNLFKSFRRFYTDTAIRADAIVVYFG